MRYVEGFVGAVPAANKELYKEHIAAAAKLFKAHGALRFVECWGDDVPNGSVTDFPSAVKAEEGEVVVFSWIEYPSKEVRDQANEKVQSDPRLKKIPDMPFDAKRMIYGGFQMLLDE